jgi:hypothetical protein
MRPLPAPDVPGKTEAERMSNALRMVLTVSKDDLLREEKKWRKARTKKKRGKKTS